MAGPGSFSFDSSGSPLSGPQGGARTLVVSEPLTMAVANRMLQQLALLDEPSEDPLRVMMSNAPGGEGRAALSVYDALQSLEAPVTMLGGGRIVGPGVVAFVGADRERRVGLPHVQFRLEPPAAPEHAGAGSGIEGQAAEAQEHEERVVTFLATATGQSEDQIASDLASRRVFDAEAAVEYGLIDRIVQSRRAIE